MLKKLNIAALAVALAGLTVAPIAQCAVAMANSQTDAAQKDSSSSEKIKADNPCAPAKKKAANPCAPTKKKAANPCSLANPCGPAKRKSAD